MQLKKNNRVRASLGGISFGYALLEKIQCQTVSGCPGWDVSSHHTAAHTFRSAACPFARLTLLYQLLSWH